MLLTFITQHSRLLRPHGCGQYTYRGYSGVHRAQNVGTHQKDNIVKLPVQLASHERITFGHQILGKRQRRRKRATRNVRRVGRKLPRRLLAPRDSSTTRPSPLTLTPYQSARRAFVPQLVCLFQFGPSVDRYRTRSMSRSVEGGICGVEVCRTVCKNEKKWCRCGSKFGGKQPLPRTYV